MDAGGDSWWPMVNAPELLARRGFSPSKVRLARRFYNGQTAPWEFLPTLMRLGGAYDPHTSFRAFLRQVAAERRSKPRPEAHRFAVQQLTKDWTVMNRLGEIEAPTLASPDGKTSCSRPSTRHSSRRGSPARSCGSSSERAQPHDEQTDEVMDAVAGSSTEVKRDGRKKLVGSGDRIGLFVLPVVVVDPEHRVPVGVRGRWPPRSSGRSRSSSRPSGSPRGSGPRC